MICAAGINFCRQMTCVVAATLLFLASSSSAKEHALSYPETRRVDHVDEYHGVQVADPYRWLEQDVRESEEVADWVEAQNAVARKYLDALPQREPIRALIEKLWNYPRVGTPFHRGETYFFTKNDGLQDQSVLYLAEGLDGEPRVLLDPNTWSEDGTIALSGFSVDEEGRLAAYGVQEAGSDWHTWKLLNVQTGEKLTDEIRWTKWTDISWLPDGRGFFYSRYPEPEEGEAYQSANFNGKIYYHRVGTEQEQDVLVYERPDHPEWNLHGEVTEDGRYLLIYISKGTDRKNMLYLRDLAEPYAAPVALVDHFEDEYASIGNDGTRFYFRTDRDAPNKKIIAVDIRTPHNEEGALASTDLVSESENALKGISLVGNTFIAHYLEDAKSVVKLYSTDGDHLRDLELPGLGSVGGFSGRRSDTQTFYSFSSFNAPPAIYRYDLQTNETTQWWQADIALDPQDFEVEQVFYQSKDGTKVPMFLSYKKGLERNGKNPTLLYGYGGFAISITPSYSSSRLAWMEMGGIFAVANLRGGGEYGEAWHEAGKKLNKQNVFDDFMAAAEWLVDNDYTSPENLGIQGGSNGGLLVGACEVQRPELFGACLPAVGVMDMLRFHNFTAGRYWVDDYGSVENEEEFAALRAYSPYHNIKEDAEYPPTLITTADTDDRVVPSHSFKFAAALQRAQAGDAPILLRVETRAGHGSGMPISKRIDLVADQWAFLAQTLGLNAAKN